MTQDELRTVLWSIDNRLAGIQATLNGRAATTDETPADVLLPRSTTYISDITPQRFIPGAGGVMHNQEVA